MTKLFIRSVVLLAGLALILSQGVFAQAPPATPPSEEVSKAQAAIAQYPNQIIPYINLANAEVSENHPDEAIAAASHALAMPYTEATGALDTRPLAYYYLSLAYLLKGDIANALSQADAGLSRYSGSPVLSRAKGMALIASGQYSRASEVLIPAFVSLTQTTNPDNFAAWGYVWEGTDSNLGFDAVLSQYYAGQYPQAVENARQLVVLGSVCVNPEPIPGTKKQCTELTGNIASIDGHDVSRLSSGNSAFQHFLKGPVGSVANVSYRDKKKIIEAKMVRQAVPLTKKDADYLGLFALTLNANGNHEEALAMAQRAVSLAPTFWAELSYGVVLEDGNRLDEALRALETPTGMPPAYARKNLWRIHLAVLYARKGDMAKAQEFYLPAANLIDLRCAPVAQEKDAFMALVKPTVDAHLTKAKQLEAQGKYAESLPEYAQVLAFAFNEQEASTLRTAMFAASSKMPTPPEMPDDAHRHVVRGELLLNQGMMDRASAEFNEALRIAPYMPKLYYNTALIHGELKQYDQAIRQMHLYLTVAPETPDARTAQDQITKWELLQEMGGKR